MENEFSEPQNQQPDSFKDKIWPFVRKHKYLWFTIAFLVVFVFLAENNLLLTLRLHKEVSALKKQEEVLREEIYTDSVKFHSLSGDADALEHYGREHYYMKCNDEDIFIVK